MKAHTNCESLILTECQSIVKTMFGAVAEKEINKIPLSDNTMSRRITDMHTRRNGGGQEGFHSPLVFASFGLGRFATGTDSQRPIRAFVRSCSVICASRTRLVLGLACIMYYTLGASHLDSVFAT